MAGQCTVRSAGDAAADDVEFVRLCRGRSNSMDVVKTGRIPTRRSMRLLLVALCVTVATAGVVAEWRLHERAQPCWPVRQLLTFNIDTQASLKAKTRFAPAGSHEEDSIPTPADYQAWLAGLQQRANQVTDAALSVHAQRAARLAKQFMTAANQMNDEVSKQDFLHPSVPPSARDAARINRDFVDELATMAHACPI